MSITYTERPTNTEKQIHEYLTTAEKILKVQGYDPHTDLQLLCQVLALVASKQVIAQQREQVGVDLSQILGGGNGRR